MLRSMTGFASATQVLTLPDGSSSEVTFYLKSLNSRYFEALCRFPYPLSILETDVAKLLKEKLLRGKATFSLYISQPHIFKSTIEPAIPLIKQYINATNHIKQQCSISGNLTIETLLMLPNIFTVEEQTLDTTSKQRLLQTINHLIDELVAVQEEEGSSIKKDLLKRIEFIKKDINRIDTASKQLVEEQKQKVHATLSEFEDDESKFIELKKYSLYAVLDKIDIHEEVMRFKSHVSTIVDQLQSKTVEKGKRLDFTLQELNREINTIAAKASDSEIGSLAINIKVEIEKAREQAQNIV